MTKTRFRRMVYLTVLLLSACTSQSSAPSSQPPTIPPIQSTAIAAREISPDMSTTQTGATTTRDKVGFILGNLLILSLYSFPMSYAITWAFGDPKKAKKQQIHESPDAIGTADTLPKVIQTVGDEAPATADDWITSSERLPLWIRKLPRVTAGLATGGCLMIGVVALGAAAFALYYLVTGQSDEISQVLPRFAYWFPFALLGMVTEIPFQIIYWEDRRLRVLLRLVIWWFPRIIIIAFVINPPILQDLDPATTALVVLVIDGVLAAFCLGLYTAREQMGMKSVQ